MMGHFVEVCRSLKINANKTKATVTGGEEGLECEVYVDGINLQHITEFKCLGCISDESSTGEAECRRNVVSGSRVSGAIRSLVIARDLHETLLAPILRGSRMLKASATHWDTEYHRI